MTSSNQIRQAFLDFFQEREHTLVPSSSIVPINDPTLLFVNAGMVQFKELFLGDTTANYSRAVSVQRCVRAGGKHNDLENVGYTARHHTFFEMLGNFSFGDYFKQRAIAFAWEFLTQVVNLSEEKLWVTVFEEDKEAADIWLNEVGISPERLRYIGAKDNFWSMGDTGPCGPCSEIFYDHGPDVAGGPPGSPDEDGDRYIEVWNLVFMQYDRQPDGELIPLPKPSVDTGMGLERLVAILQNVHSNYEIDIFKQIIAQAAIVTQCKDINDPSLKVIADHIRSTAFLIVDGVIPSNEGRGYVLKRIIRRAIRHGYKLGMEQPFFHRLVEILDQQMGGAYPELRRNKKQIAKTLKNEELRFAETLDQGMQILEKEIAQLKNSTIPGTVAFKLYDTYGFPLDLTADIAREQGLTVDQNGFDQAMEAQRQMARSAQKFGLGDSSQINLDTTTEFVGYETLQQTASVTRLLNHEHAPVDQLNAGEQGAIVLDQSPFYAESGGQAGDLGQLISSSGTFIVEDTQKNHDAILHYGHIQDGKIETGSLLTANVDTATRQATALNHTATHLLHAALQNLLGDHVTQKGSLVNAERLRFDFSHAQPVSTEELETLEREVNQQIRTNQAVLTRIMNIDDARQSGAMALFGEKYADEVRVLSIGDYSIELCGGIHAERAGAIGLFKITHESGIAAGVRRIEAITGINATEHAIEQSQTISSLSRLLNSKPNQLTPKVQHSLGLIKSYEKEIQQLKTELAQQQGGSLLETAKEINGISVLVATLENIDSKVLRETVDQFKNQLGSSVVLLAAVTGEKIALTCGVSKEVTDRVHAGKLINHVATQIGGKGGGRPDMAQAGGCQLENLPTALDSVYSWVTEKLTD